jgi:hypothetical protein
MPDKSASGNLYELASELRCLAFYGCELGISLVDGDSSSSPRASRGG